MTGAAEIRTQIAALDAAIRDAESDAAGLALPVVQRIDGAAGKLADLHHRLDVLRRDRGVLVAALEAAERNEREAAAIAAETERLAGEAAAQRHADQLAILAMRFDELVEDVGAVVEAMTETEAEIHASLRAAGRRDLGVRSGRRGLAVTAIDVLQARIRGLWVTDRRTVTERAKAAWGDPLESTSPLAPPPSPLVEFVPPIANREVDVA